MEYLFEVYNEDHKKIIKAELDDKNLTAKVFAEKYSQLSEIEKLELFARIKTH